MEARHVGSRSSSGLRENYTANELNQYTGRENNTLAIDGVADTEEKKGGLSREAEEGDVRAHDYRCQESSPPGFSAVGGYFG